MRTEQTTGKGTAAMTTGARMKQRRKELGISVEAVAAALGVSVATVYRYEKGDIEKVPGAFYHIGVRNPEIGAVHPLHSGKFLVDENAIVYGAAVHAQVAARFLEQK